MTLIGKQLSGETPKGGTMIHGITAGGIAKPILVNSDGTVNVTGDVVASDGGGSLTIDYNDSPISTSNPLPIQPPASGYLPTLAYGSDDGGTTKRIIKTDSGGAIQVDVESGTIGTLTGGGVAHDGVDSGNPIKIGHKAVSTQSGQTAVASGDRTDSITDLDGSLITRMTTHGDSVSGVASTTGTSDTSVVAAQGASTYFYVTGFSIANTGSTTTLITFKDGSGGSALWYTIAPTGGGSNFSQGGKPIFKTSANTALYFACASASTTVYVSVTGYKSKV